MYLFPSPSLMYTNTFCSAPSSTTYDSARASPVPHAGSDVILITGFSGALPSSRTLPVMFAAVDESTFFASGAAAGEEGLADLLLSDPPHAASPARNAPHANAL